MNVDVQNMKNIILNQLSYIPVFYFLITVESGIWKHWIWKFGLDDDIEASRIFQSIGLGIIEKFYHMCYKIPNCGVLLTFDLC
jgi:hypothetical protein